MTNLNFDCILYLVSPPVEYLSLTSLYLALLSHWRRLKTSKHPFVLKMYMIAIYTTLPPLCILPILLDKALKEPSSYSIRLFKFCQIFYNLFFHILQLDKTCKLFIHIYFTWETWQIFSSIVRLVYKLGQTFISMSSNI